jgi:hypothetical protein
MMWTQFASRADASMVCALELLARLYGMSCIQKDSAFFLASGVLNAVDIDALRASTLETFDALTAQGGKLALKLCEGFGLPEALIATPISKVSSQC